MGIEESSHESLNPQQKEAVTHVNGPCLVLAGAGTGKTKVLIERVRYLINSGYAALNNVMLLTFTNKAAREMKERVNDALNANVSNMWVGTFHSICVRILRQNAEFLGISNHFSIIDADDQVKLLKQIIASDFPEEKDNLKRIVSCINSFKDRGLVSEDIGQGEPYKAIYYVYQERLRVLNAFDFGDLILSCIELFKKCPEVLERFQEQFKFIMVDEYQDTNVAQYIWLRLFSQKSGNLFCVGDDDQSIYAWRGAEIENILRFDKDLKDCKVIRLEQNYRSTNHIVSVASSLINCNKNRMGKTLWTDMQDVQKVIIQGTWDSEDEARLISESINRDHQNGTKFSDMAILVRASFQTREFEERFIKVGIPYYVLGSVRFYERQEIKDSIAYFRVIFQPDDALAFERILNTPKRGIGLTSIRRIHALAREQGISFTKAAKVYSETPGQQNSKNSLKNFFNQIESWKQVLEEKDHVEFARTVLEESGYIKIWKDDKTQEAAHRLENIKELLRAMREFENLQSFLDHVSIFIENTTVTDDCVKIMTLHGSKGLEFDHVYLPGWEEGVFPHQRCIAESGESGLEEERRLAYVGISRAKKKLWISYTMQRRYYHSWQTNIPSRFIKELPQEHIQHFNPNGVEIHNPPSTDFIIGERVFHEKYGHGDIIDLDDYGLYIKFDYSGIKKISQKFVAKAS